jgi:hypothetical protein
LIGTVLIVLAVLALAGAAAAKKPPAAANVALAAIDRQANRGRLTPPEASRYRGIVDRTARLAARLPEGRATPLRSQLQQAASIAPVLTAPRALAVFSQLEVNDDWFARRGAPAVQTDITDADGVVYRYFPGRGFEFHPLANFGALNAVAGSKNVVATTKLASALLARAVVERNGTVWEYYFDYSGGRAPWLSGFAQAVAAQALARAATVDQTDATALREDARGAYRSLPGRLLQATGFGPWIRLYGFNHDVVLNAQLQSALSLADYAKTAANTEAGALAEALKTAAARALPSFSTGYWSYYALPGDISNVHYQDYVAQLLGILARRDGRFTAAAAEFASFRTRPPQFRLGSAGVGQVTFWISKPSSIRISALGSERRFSAGGGWHTVSWPLPSRPGIFPVSIRATDWVGNSTSVDALPLVHVAAPPRPKKHKAKRTVASARAASTLPPLVVSAGLDQPEQASLAAQAGLGGVRMTLLWPQNASVPDPGAIGALAKLPPGTNLTLALWASSLPADDGGRAALAAYASSLVQQVPTLRDLVLEPAPTPATAAAYAAALAAVDDAVKSAGPTIRIAGSLDGSAAPAATVKALGTTYRASGRAGALMDELDFTPAGAAAKGVWTLTSLPTLTGALGSAFDGTGQPGSSLPLLVDGITADTGAAALRAIACKPTVQGLLFARLVDGPTLDTETGLFAADGTAKPTLTTLTGTISTAQGSTRGCAATSPASPPAAQPAPAPAPPPAAPSKPPSVSKPPTTSTPPATSPPPTVEKPTAVDAPDQLSFPAGLSTAAQPKVHLGCTAACLYLVTLQRATDGAPVLATRGVLTHAGGRSVILPRAPTRGSYRLAVWTVAQSNPGPVSVDRSQILSAR